MDWYCEEMNGALVGFVAVPVSPSRPREWFQARKKRVTESLRVVKTGKMTVIYQWTPLGGTTSPSDTSARRGTVSGPERQASQAQR